MLGRMGARGGFGSMGGAAGHTITYDPAAASLFARMTTAPSPARKAAISAYISALKTASIWSKLDALYSLAANDTQAALLNWVANQYNATAVNTPTFTANQGYAGDGTTSYIDTNFTPSSAVSPQYALNSASAFVKSNTNLRADGSSIFGQGTVTINPENVGNANATVSINGTSALAGSPTTTLDLFTLSRVSSSAYNLYQNSTLLSSQVSASTTVPTSSFRILSDGTNFSTRQIQLVGFGASLSATDVTNLNTATIAYLTAINAIGNFFG